VTCEPRRNGVAGDSDCPVVADCNPFAARPLLCALSELADRVRLHCGVKASFNLSVSTEFQEPLAAQLIVMNSLCETFFRQSEIYFIADTDDQCSLLPFLKWIVDLARKPNSRQTVQIFRGPEHAIRPVVAPSKPSDGYIGAGTHVLNSTHPPCEKPTGLMEMQPIKAVTRPDPPSSRNPRVSILSAETKAGPSRNLADHERPPYKRQAV